MRSQGRGNVELFSNSENNKTEKNVSQTVVIAMPNNSTRVMLVYTTHT